jgi:hypothetical protein
MKKLFTKTLLTAVAFMASVTLVTAQTSGTDWTLSAEGHLTVGSDAGMKDWTQNSTASTKTKVKSATIEEGVTGIGAEFHWLFGIQDYGEPFSECILLESVEIPASVQYIGSGAFRHCFALKSIEIPQGVTDIRQEAFAACISLKSITFAPGSLLKTVGNRLFSGCSALTDLEIPPSVTSIGEYAFDGCNILTDITFAEGSQLATIGNNVFRNCGITDIEIPALVTSIGTSAFDSGTDPFGGNNTLKSITFAPNSQLKTIGDYAFRNCVALTDIEIPAQVTGIGVSAFNACTALANVTFDGGGQSLTTMGNSAFAGCGSLRNIEIPAGLQTIQNGIFPPNLSNITFAEGSQLKTIEASAFGGIYSSESELQSIEIPASVTTIGNYAFSYCKDLWSVTFAPNSQLKTIGNNVFGNCGSLEVVGEIPASVTVIGSNAFERCTTLKNVTFAEGSQLTTVGDFAFANCETLTGISIPAGVTGISRSMFQGCKALTGVTVAQDNQLKTIGDYAFQNCIALTGISVPAGITSIGREAFRGCTVLAGVVFAEGGSQLKTIGNNAFQNCTALAGISIPVGVTNIGTYAFQNCTALAGGISIPAGVQTIESYTFDGCTNLASVIFAEGSLLQTVGTYAFRDCDKLTDIIIPAGVTAIRDYAFYSCDVLTGVIFATGSQLKTVGQNAFYNFIASNIEIPAGVTNIGNLAFASNAPVQNITFLGSKTNFISSAGFRVSSAITSIFRVPCGDTSWDSFTPGDSSYNNIVLRHGCPITLESFRVKWSDAVIDEEAKTITIDKLHTDQSDCMEVYFGMSEDFAYDYEVYLEGDNSVSMQLGTAYDDQWGSGWNEYVCFTDVSGWEGTLYIVQKDSAPLPAKAGIQRNAAGSIVEGLNVVTTYSVSIGDNGVSTGIAGGEHIQPLPKAYYNTLGQQLSEEPASGIYIILYDNGKTEKRVK